MRKIKIPEEKDFKRFDLPNNYKIERILKTGLFGQSFLVLAKDTTNKDSYYICSFDGINNTPIQIN